MGIRAIGKLVNHFDFSIETVSSLSCLGGGAQFKTDDSTDVASHKNAVIPNVIYESIKSFRYICIEHMVLEN